MAKNKRSDAVLEEKGTEEKREAARFIKQQLLASKQYQNKKDLLHAILKEEEWYTLAEVKQKMEYFMKGKVK